MVFGRIRTPPAQNDAMNIEDSRLFNDASSSSFTTTSNAQTNTASINNVNSTMNYGEDIAVFWESAALRFPSLFTNDLSPSASSSLGRESNADSASWLVALLGRHSLPLKSVVSRSKNGRGLLSLALLTLSSGICDNARSPFAPRNRTRG